MQSCIYSGQVSHGRQAPLRHVFRYGVYMLYLDLDELDEVFAGRWLWSTRRPALARFRREDHFGDPAEPLADSVRNLVLQRTGRQQDGPIRLLTNLSWLGYCFNPLSIYYCFDRDDTRVTAIVADVSNTPWGERCLYVLPDSMNTGRAGMLRFRTGKDMHVSPFMPMDLEYDWRLTQPADRLVVGIDNRYRQKRFFNATLALKREEISGPALAAVLARYPAMTLKVVFGIYWQAFRLWLKGTPLHSHPDKQKSIEANS